MNFYRFFLLIENTIMKRQKKMKEQFDKKNRSGHCGLKRGDQVLLWGKGFKNWVGPYTVVQVMLSLGLAEIKGEGSKNNF